MIKFAVHRKSPAWPENDYYIRFMTYGARCLKRKFSFWTSRNIYADSPRTHCRLDNTDYRERDLDVYPPQNGEQLGAALEAASLSRGTIDINTFDTHAEHFSLRHTTCLSEYYLQLVRRPVCAWPQKRTIIIDAQTRTLSLIPPPSRSFYLYYGPAG